MKNANRKFYSGEVHHIYQRAVDGFNIFYDLADYLVFYTIFSIFLKRFNITSLALCLMIDHFHALLICETKTQLSRFIASFTSLYSRLFNETISRKGRLFDKSFGSAPKSGEKQVRTVISYVFNNPVEKKICYDPLLYQWDFLAYMESDHPYSEKYDASKASKKLISARKEVTRAYADERWLTYTQLIRLCRGLSSKELAQLTDHIIKTYLPFDNKKLLSYYKSYDMMKIAISSNTGSEYSIREEYNPYSDTVYSEIDSFVRNVLKISPKSLLQLPLDEKLGFAQKIAANTTASYRQIAKYLHVSIQKPDA